MNPRPARSPTFWTLQFGGWGLYAVLLIITFLPMHMGEGKALPLVMAKGIRAVFGLGLTSVMRLAYQRLFPGTFQRQAVWAMATSALVGMVWVALAEVWAVLLYPQYSWVGNRMQFPRLALDYAVTLLGWSGLYFGIKHARAWQSERERALRADTLAQEARLASLRHQMHPHFLFNALTSVRALIGEDPVRARRMVTEMADFLRFSLQKGDFPHVPLEEELSMVRSYLSIESVRFEEKLDVSLSVMPGTERLTVPAFLIQPLVDNAVKHGLASGILPVRVRIHVTREQDLLRIQVDNTGTWAPRTRELGPQGTGTGLRNVRERLAQLFAERARLESSESDGWVHTVVELPAMEWTPVLSTEAA
ncbi:Sensor protein lytS [Myxococcus stipitatus DSM 14675]|uniref:Sensor protein lytS n=1 Tax=Myxococcus stipitatus (strain DSM 14675 / JCM 12634 / Mx s8) TaxID=1278073 RepID=L7U2Y9_MYXSD|nr:histidine kinase [Myxococcus stipitatus]AGC43146.1 Sensor protein lytS [Myxococcus stipitatus DSM 14675]